MLSSKCPPMTCSSALLLLQLLLLLLAPDAASAAALVMTPEQKAEALNIHNQLRRSVYPSAADMNYQTWNPRLEELAQLAANSCIFEHNYGGPYAGLGENLYQGWRTNATDIVTFFFMEHLAYDYAKKACGLANVLGLGVCGHYLQAAGATVAEVGCAIAECGSSVRLFVCEYDKMYPSYVYTEGAPCAACPSAAGYCLHGLCANGSLVQEPQLLASQGNATCSIVCKNCGSRVDNRTASPPICDCSCPAGYGSDHCSVKSSATHTPPAGCGPCAQQGTPCLNGGVESGNSSCSCQCPAGNFTGPQCQLSSVAYGASVYLKLSSGNQFCSSGQCAKVPANSMSFQQQVWPTLSAALTAGVNNYCRRDAASFARCCPSSSSASASSTAAGGVITGSLLSASDMSYVETSLKTGASGDLEVAAFAVPQPGNSLCSGSVRRRRRAAAPAAASGPVPVDVLSASIAAANGSISASLSGCCGGLAVTSVGSYKAVVDAMYGYGGSSGGSGSWRRTGAAAVGYWLLTYWLATAVAASVAAC